MEQDKDQYHVLDLLIMHEEKIGELYHIYAENFPELSGFWEKISAEELGHAALLKGMRSRIKAGEALFRRDKFPLQAVRLSLAHVERLIEEAINVGRPLPGALNAAQDIEQGLIEMEYYKVLDGDSEEVAAIFNRLGVEEKRHRIEIQEKLAALKKKSA